jgi:superfamily II DNA or RNA helicase
MLWLHQQEAIEWANGRRDVLLWMGMGTGKTRTALEIIKAGMVAGSIRRILVGCPKAVIPAWAKQARLWLPEIRVVLLDRGTSADKGKQIVAAMADTSPVVIVGNYESLWRIKEIEKVSWDCLVWDEVHRLKSPSGAASRWAAKLAKKNPTAKRLGLSGTLLAHALAVDCPVLTPDGWRPMGDLKVGDKVIGSCGVATEVTGVWPQGIKPMFRVSFSDHDSIECTGDHLWAVTSRGRDCRGLGPVVVRTDELDKPRPAPKSNGKPGRGTRCSIFDSCGAPRWAIPIVKPVEFAAGGSLPLDPYLLGVILGDGSTGHSICITSADAEIVEEVRRALPGGYFLVRKDKRQEGEAADYRISSGKRGGSEKGPRRGPKKNPVAVALEEMGLRGLTSATKFIPDQYLFSSRSDRLSILQGLCDTDGSAAGSCAVYTTISPRLADGVRHLAQSLGGYVHTAVEQPRISRLPQGTTCLSRLKYKLTIRTPCCPFRLSRKASKWLPCSERIRRNIVAVEPAGFKEAQCITVDAADGLFVADRFIVTHNSPLDAYGVYRAVESPECPTFGTSYTVFKATYAVTNPHVPGMVIGWRNREQFAAKVAATTFHRKSEDVLDLPPIHHVEVPVELTAKEAKVYRQLEKEFCAQVDGGTITPANAMVGLLRMLQATSGFMRLDDETETKQIDETPSKRAAFADLLEDMPEDEPLVVFCRFRSDIDSALAACKSLGRSTSELSGKIDTLADWQAGKTTVLVAQIQSGGIGIDLTRASVGVFYSLGHSLSEWLQAIARLHRPGQERRTRFFSLVATLQSNTTADGRVYEALSQRKEVIDVIISGYRAAHQPPVERA